jgi:2-polyprenyl-6-methoxyphenol hydroxylase-like FAD-dependent oxidoreductase
VLVIGAGPTGLGAATRLHQHGSKDWLLVDQVGRSRTQHFDASLPGFPEGFDMRSYHAVSMQGYCGLVAGNRSAKPHAAMCRSRAQGAWPAQTSHRRASCSTWVDT